MTEDRLFEHLDALLRPLGASADDGEEFRAPPLDVLRYYRRPVRLNRLPVLGRGLGVVAVARQPVDLPFTPEGGRELLTRLARAAGTRFPPTWGHGLALGLTAVVLTPEPIGPRDEGVLSGVVTGAPLPRLRAVPLGLIRVNLGQEAVAFSLATGPDQAFPEPVTLADGLAEHLRRFVPLMEG